MRKPYKFLLAAVALLATTACSSDDSRAEEQTDNAVRKGELVMSVEPLEVGDVNSRAYRSNSNQYLHFIAGDGTRVYTKLSDYQTRYDTYFFNESNNKFEISGTNYLVGDDTPYYAFYPHSEVLKAYYEENVPAVEFAINDVTVFDENSKIVVDGQNLFKCDVPMFGYVTGTADGGLQVKNLRLMTALVRLNIANIKSETTYIRITTQQCINESENEDLDEEIEVPQLSGGFRANLDPDAANRANVVLKEGFMMRTYPDIYFDVRNAPAGASVIYVPMLAGVNGGDLRLMTTTKEPAIVNDKEQKPQKFDASDWTLQPSVKFPAKTMQQQHLYTVNLDEI